MECPNTGSGHMARSCGVCEMQDFGLESIDLELFLSGDGAEENIRTLEKSLMGSPCVGEIVTPNTPACHVNTSLHHVTPTGVLTPGCDVTMTQLAASPLTSSGVAQYPLQQLSPQQQQQELQQELQQQQQDLQQQQQEQQQDFDDEAQCKEDVKVEFDVTAHDLALARLGDQEFDPRKSKLKDEDLRPQPMVKKATKRFVEDDSKDDTYWERRKKNNVAAKRSRDARRAKENQIVMRAAFLEKENEALRETIARMKQELNATRRSATVANDLDSASLRDENARLRLALAKMSDVLKCL